MRSTDDHVLNLWLNCTPMAACSHWYGNMVEEADPKEVIKVLTYGTSKASRYVKSEMKPAYRNNIAFVANPVIHYVGMLTSRIPLN